MTPDLFTNQFGMIPSMSYTADIFRCQRYAHATTLETTPEYVSNLIRLTFLQTHALPPTHTSNNICVGTRYVYMGGRTHTWVGDACNASNTNSNTYIPPLPFVARVASR